MLAFSRPLSASICGPFLAIRVSMNLSRPFALRPVATVLFMAAILLSGIVAYYQLPVSALAAGRLSHDPGAHVLSRRLTGRDGVVGHRSFGAAIRPGARAGANDVHQFRRLFRHHAAVQSGIGHRRRRAAGAGVDQRGFDVSAAGPAEPADLHQDESRRRPHSDVGADFRNAAAVAGGRPRRDAVRAEDLAVVRRGAGQHQRRAEAGHPHSGQPDGVVVVGDRPQRAAKRGRHGQRQPGEREFRRLPAILHHRRE